MAWVTQTFMSNGVTASLGESKVILGVSSGAKGLWFDKDMILHIEPASKEESHNLALIFRRIARRLEEIGKGLDEIPSKQVRR
jgi:hypothetical protein